MIELSLTFKLFIVTKVIRPYGMVYIFCVYVLVIASNKVKEFDIQFCNIRSIPSFIW